MTAIRRTPRPLDKVSQVTSPVPPSLPAAVLWDMDGTRGALGNFQVR